MYRYQSIMFDFHYLIMQMIPVSTLTTSSALAPAARRNNANISEGRTPRDSVPRKEIVSRKSVEINVGVTLTVVPLWKHRDKGIYGS